MKRKVYSGDILTLEPHQYYVFGSNTEGRHGLGAALIAKTNFGAKYGQAKGLQGQSYAIITKDLTKKVHPSVSKDFIVEQIKEFYDFARHNPKKEYVVIYSGIKKNLNAYSSNEMAEMFGFAGLKEIPPNIIFEHTFYKLIKEL